MISAAAFCPQAPILVPLVAAGAAPELDELRAACRAAIRRVTAPGRQLVVLGVGPTQTGYGPNARGTFAGFGVALEVSLGSDDAGPVELPPALTVGAWLVRDALGPNSGAIGCAVTTATAPDDDLLTASWTSDREDVALLVLGDGSARRSTSAPGYLDERAAGFDADIAGALGRGDSGALRCLDPVLGLELLAAGVAAWRVAGDLVSAANTPWDAELLYDHAPYGVGYFAAAWTPRA